MPTFVNIINHATFPTSETVLLATSTKESTMMTFVYIIMQPSPPQLRVSAFGSQHRGENNDDIWVYNHATYPTSESVLLAPNTEERSGPPLSPWQVSCTPLPAHSWVSPGQQQQQPQPQQIVMYFG